MQQYFGLLQETIDKLGVQPNQIFNCDETGWSGNKEIQAKGNCSKGTSQLSAVSDFSRTLDSSYLYLWRRKGASNFHHI